MKPTQKQINYALFLLKEKGYSTNFMDAQFKALGASMKERSGKVSVWLDSMNSGEISSVIDTLKRA